MGEPAAALEAPEEFLWGRQMLYLSDGFDWLSSAPANSVHAIMRGSLF